MSYETIQAATDFYIDFISEISAKMPVPPKLEVFHYNENELQGDLWLHVIERKNPKTNNVFAIRYFISNNAKDALGLVSFEEYSTLPDELDLALSEYRRKNFKRISRQQRHADDETKYKNPRQARSEV